MISSLLKVTFAGSRGFGVALTWIGVARLWLGIAL